MNGKKAKAIRKVIYKGNKEESVHDRGYTELFGGIFISTGDRRKYKLAKKIYKNTKQITEI